MRKYHARFLEGWTTVRSSGYSADPVHTKGNELIANALLFAIVILPASVLAARPAKGHGPLGLCFSTPKDGSRSRMTHDLQTTVGIFCR
jgi:hypothetical protein